MSKLIHLFFKLGQFSFYRAWGRPWLTILTYHRITDPHAPGFDTFIPNVSATPQGFAAQMDFIQQHFRVVSVGEVLAWLRGGQLLPLNPALITFDDGYYDNFQYAFPILQQRRLPAVIYLATDYINSATPFYWDLIAYSFYHTTQTGADLPLIGPQQWSNVAGRTAVMRLWIDRLKTIPDQEKWSLVRQLPQILGVTVPAAAFAGLHLTWDNVRCMVAAGIDMGAHTQSHPILTRVSLEQARSEVVGSKAKIEAELGRPITTFAFPNGQPPDFNPELQAMLRQVGFEAAFTLRPGPTSLHEVRHTPLAIRRVAISHKDNLFRFAAKVLGLPRWFNNF